MHHGNLRRKRTYERTCEEGLADAIRVADTIRSESRQPHESRQRAATLDSRANAGSRTQERTALIMSGRLG